MACSRTTISQRARRVSISWSRTRSRVNVHSDVPCAGRRCGAHRSDERASRAQSAGYVFLPNDENAETVQAFLQLGYEKTRLEEIKVPAWREAAREAQPAGTQIFAKKLREQRVFKPI